MKGRAYLEGRAKLSQCRLGRKEPKVVPIQRGKRAKEIREEMAESCQPIFLSLGFVRRRIYKRKLPSDYPNESKKGEGHTKKWQTS